MMNLSKNLNVYRRRAGFTQESLAERLGVSRQAVSKWESDRSRPELESLMSMAELYGCTVDDLLQGPPPEELPPEEEEEGPDWALFEAYDQEQRAFALQIAGAVGLVLLGIALSSLFSGRYPGLSALAFFLPLAAAVYLFISGGLRHEAFQRAHSDVPNCYTAEEKQQFQRLFVTGLPVAIALVLVDVALTGFLGEFGVIGSSTQGFLFFLMLSASVTILVALGILRERFNVDAYNKVARKIGRGDFEDFDL